MKFSNVWWWFHQLFPGREKASPVEAAFQDWIQLHYSISPSKSCIFLPWKFQPPPDHSNFGQSLYCYFFRVGLESGYLLLLSSCICVSPRTQTYNPSFFPIKEFIKSNWLLWTKIRQKRRTVQFGSGYNSQLCHTTFLLVIVFLYTLLIKWRCKNGQSQKWCQVLPQNLPCHQTVICLSYEFEPVGCENFSYFQSSFFLKPLS